MSVLVDQTSVAVSVDLCPGHNRKNPSSAVAATAGNEYVQIELGHQERSVCKQGDQE